MAKANQERLWLGDISKMDKKGFQCMSLFRIIHPHVKIPPGSQGVHPSEGSQSPRSTDIRAGSWRGQKGWPITYASCILRRPSWCLPVGRRVKRLPGPGHPQELCCGAGPCTPCLQGPPALRGPAKARPRPPHGPQPHSDSGARPPQHQAATRGQTRTGKVRSWSKGVKWWLCGQSKSAVHHAAGGLPQRWSLD